MDVIVYFIIIMSLTSMTVLAFLVFLHEKEKRRIEEEKRNLVRKLEELEVSFTHRVNFEVEKYKEKDRKDIEKRIREILEKEYETKLDEWKRQEKERIEKMAIEEYGKQIFKKIGDKLAPFYILNKEGIIPHNLRFIGYPIDFLAFKGLEEQDYDNLEIYFIRIITSLDSINLSMKEEAIRNAILNHRIKWLDINVGNYIDEALQVEKNQNPCKQNY